MDLFNVFALLTTFAAVFAWLNYRYLRLPTTIGLMVIALAFSLVLITVGSLGIAGGEGLVETLRTIDFDDTLLRGMLGALLFAGALHVDLGDLASRRWTIAVLATGGVVLSTILVGSASYFVFRGLGIEIGFWPCLLFGSLIAPTDPVAVLGIVKRVAVPKSLAMKIAGESMFNDGVGVVIFTLLLPFATGHVELHAGEIAHLLALEIVGGLLFGLCVGVLAFQMLKRIDQPQVEVLITLAIVTGGYALAQHLHLSGPLAMVVAGLLIGNQGRSFAMSDRTRERLDIFWELIDELLNALLFMLIGFELLVVRVGPESLTAGAIAVVIVLAARWTSVATTVTVLRVKRTFSPHVVKVLTWGGLRGGISVALALSLPPGPEKATIVAVTYIVVAFSIIVQGLTLEPFVKRLYGPGASAT
ncbi:MAG: sodium:proton antiporter [Gemmatimonadales bacterium]|jgi:CPA1 family monovalent cation:H+ antiporter